MAPLTDLENLSGSTLNFHDADYSVDPVAEKRLLWRMDIRIMPMAIMMFFLSFIDRANIGNAKVLNADVNHSFVQSLHLTDSQYRIAVLVLMITYALFDIPSSYLLKRFRPSRWLSFLMFVWGGLTMILGAVNSFPGAVAIRILLGVFEAGLLPGLIYFLTFWYSPWERALRIALILSSAPLSGAVGGLLAYAIGHMDEVRGLEGWRWLFILEGVPSCLCAFAVFFFFPDFPETAQWLSSAERELATKRLRGECSVGHAHISWDDVRATLSDARLYLHYIKGLLLGVTLSSTSVFGPSIMAGLGYKGLAAQLFTVPPLVATFVLMIPAGWVADRYGIRSIVGIIGMSVAALAFLAQGFVEPTAVHLRYGLFTVSIAFSTAASPPMLSWLTGNLRSTSAATFAVPLNVAAVAIGQIIGVYIYMAREAPGYQTGHYINGICCLLNAAIAAVLRLIYVRRNRTLSKGERRWHL